MGMRKAKNRRKEVYRNYVFFEVNMIPGDFDDCLFDLDSRQGLQVEEESLIKDAVGAAVMDFGLLALLHALDFDERVTARKYEGRQENAEM